MKTLFSLLVSLLLSAGLYAQSFDDYRAAAESGDPVAVSNAVFVFSMAGVWSKTMPRR